MHDKRLFGVTTVGSKGQAVIPAEAREAMGIKPGDRLYVVGSPSAHWVGFIQEDQLRAMLDHLTGDLEKYKQALDQSAEK